MTAQSALSVLFLGTPQIAAESLKALLADNQYSVKTVVTQPDRPAGRGAQISAPPVKTVALASNIPVLQPISVKKAGLPFIEQLRSYGPFDIGVVVAFGQILPIELLDLPRAGSVNLHTSLLPRWRGAAPIQRAILAGDTETGVCLMRMEAGLDTGPVYVSERVAISEQDNFASLHDTLSRIGAALLKKNLAAIASGSLTARAQSNDGVTYAHKITNEEAEISWSNGTKAIVRQVHAFSPSPGAFTFLDGKRFKIFKAFPAKELRASSPPGTIRLENNQLFASCTDGEIALLEVQLEGKRRMEILEFLKGASFVAGQKLGR